MNTEFLTTTYLQQRQTLLELPDTQLETLRRAVDDELFRRSKKRNKRRKVKE